jgi:putative ABC transport system permease protein
MRVIKYFGVAWQSIQAHRMRAILTMLGIIIGIAAVLVTVGIGSGTAASITERIESSGTNLLTVSSGSRGSTSSTLTMADAEVLGNTSNFPTVVGLAPQYSSQTTVANGATNGTYQVVGTNADYATIRNLTISGGSFLQDSEAGANSYSAVLGATVASDLYGGQDPVGQSIRIGDALFQVVGVLKKSGSSGFGSSDSQVFVPINVAHGRLFNTARYRGSYIISSISVKVASEDQLDSTETQIEQVLRLRHGLGKDDDNDFQINNQADLLDMASSVSGSLSALLGGIGAVSLVVGGIGIMNIMLVSVTERTREIGLRKAVGAHDRDILLQFLVEALVLCTLGGIIGIGIGYGIQALVGFIPGATLKVIIQPWAVALALGVSSASGFIFGLYPAMRATQLDPIEALRYE